MSNENASSAPSTSSITAKIKDIAEKFGLCRNRVWEIARSVDADSRDQFLSIFSSVELDQAGRHAGHDQCTFDFCEHSRLDFTSVGQRHESCAKESACEHRAFDLGLLEKALYAGKPTAWSLSGKSLIEPPQPYMAISHLWADGSGAGAWPAGHVNICLFKYFSDIAAQFQCDGLWWDTICIPRVKAARSKAILLMQRNYEDARITLVHDSFLRNWEFADPAVACLAIAISPWFSRGWTALELARSRKVKVIFKNDVIKDLDEDILMIGHGFDSPKSRVHDIAAKVIEGLREILGIIDLNGLLKILGPRHTSWPRDVAIISGQLARIAVKSRASQQEIYQEVLKKIGWILPDHLFHNSVTMSKGFSWCPTNIFNIPSASSNPHLWIHGDGDLAGIWDIFGILGDHGRYNWKGTHPLLEAELKETLHSQSKSDNVLLVIPDEKPISKAILARVIDAGKIVVQYVGPLYFHPPATREELVFHSSNGAIRVDRAAVTIAGVLSKSSKATLAAKDLDDGKLLSAAADGDRELVGLLLNKECNPGVQDEDGNTLLHLAARNGHISVVKALLEQEAVNPSARNIEGKTALHEAARDGHAEVLTILLGQAPDINLKDNNTWTALHYAVWGCHGASVWALIDANANVNIQDRLGQNALHLAAERGKEETVRLLLKSINDDGLGVASEDKQTVLHRAAFSGSEAIIKALLERNIWSILRSVDADGRTAFHIAAAKGHTPLVDILLQLADAIEGPDPKEMGDRNGLTPLLLAVKYGHFATTTTLLSKFRANVESMGDSGRTPLMWATEKGHERIAKLLLDTGADPNTPDADGRTPLVLAAERGKVGFVKLLLDKGAEKDRVFAGRSPLLWASEKGHDQVVKLLIQQNAALESRNNRGETPLIAAAKNGHGAVVRVALANNALIEATNSESKTALVIAAESGHDAVVKMLIEDGADIEYVVLKGDHGGRGTPLTRAAESGHGLVVEVLLKAGARIEDAALVGASRNEHHAVVKILLEHGATLTSPEIDPRPVLIAAIIAGQEENVRLLLERLDHDKLTNPSGLLTDAVKSGHMGTLKLLLDRRVAYEEGWDGKYLYYKPLERAFELERAEFMQVLLEYGALLESAKLGGKMLLWAVRNHHQQLAKLLLDKGADFEYKQDESRPLKLAAMNGDIQTLDLLLDKGAQVVDDNDDEANFVLDLYIANPPGKSKWAPTIVERLIERGAGESMTRENRNSIFTWAIRHGHDGMGLFNLLRDTVLAEVIQLKDYPYYRHMSDRRSPISWAAEVGIAEMVQGLVGTFGDILDIEDRSGRTAIFYAIGNTPVMQILIDAGASLDMKDQNDQTPLFYAVSTMSAESVELLLKNEADPTIEDKDGRTAKSKAVEYGHKEAINMIDKALMDWSLNGPTV